MAGTGELGGMVLAVSALAKLSRETSNTRSVASRPKSAAGRLCGPKGQKLSALGQMRKKSTKSGVGVHRKDVSGQY